MKKLTCEMCESTDLLKQDGAFVCQSCDAKYSVEEAKRMMGENTAGVDGTAKVNNAGKLDNLYINARRAKDDGNVEQAFKYYEQIILEDPDSWEANFYIAYFSAVRYFQKGEIGSSLSVVSNCLDRVFDGIEKIQDLDELKSAAKEVEKRFIPLHKQISDCLDELIERNKEQALRNFARDDDRYKLVQASKKYDDERSQSATLSGKLPSMFRVLEEKLAERRFNEYWATHQSEKENLESEKKSLIDQIADFNKNKDNEISAIPGYTDMINFKNQVQKLTHEKSTLGFLKFKEKKAIQEKIDSTEKEISQLESHVNPAIAEVNNRISKLEGRVKAIDEELTKPR